MKFIVFEDPVPVPCIFQTPLRVSSKRGKLPGSSAASYDHLCQASWRSSASWKGAWFNNYAVLHPWRPTWKLKDTQLKRNSILNTSIFGLHVKFPGCIHFILFFIQCTVSFRLFFFVGIWKKQLEWRIQGKDCKFQTSTELMLLDAVYYLVILLCTIYHCKTATKVTQRQKKTFITQFSATGGMSGSIHGLHG